VTENQRIRTLIAELVHLRGELAFLLVTLQRKGVMSADEFEKEFQQFWESHGPGLASRYLEQLESAWSKQDEGGGGGASEPEPNPEQR
jgi:hypothetical protein